MNERRKSEQRSNRKRRKPKLDEKTKTKTKTTGEVRVRRTKTKTKVKLGMGVSSFARAATAVEYTRSCYNCNDTSRISSWVVSAVCSMPPPHHCVKHHKSQIRFPPPMIFIVVASG